MEQSLKNMANTRPCHLVAMPYPGRGHINPMLNLCKLILSKLPHNFFITFVITEEWLNILSSEPKPPANFRYAALPQVIPSELSRAADMASFLKAVFTKLQDPFERLLDQLQPKPTAIIYDIFLSWLVGVGNQRNIPVASLVTNSASYFTIFSHFDLLVQHGHVPLDISEKEASKLQRKDEVLDYIPGISSTTFAELPPSFQVDGKALLNQMLDMVSATNNAQYILTTSIYEFEKQAIDSLKVKFPLPFYNIGPMIPYLNLTNETNYYEDKGSQSALFCPIRTLPNRAKNYHYYFEWLDSQPRGSVLYISQGSYLSISNEQIQEIMKGIKESNVRFLWITRGDTSRFKDGISEDKMRLFVPWCDQLRVLCHPSIGGFWTHCGWNSTSESIYAGVPMLTCPLSWDQFLQSKMIVNDLKIGWRVIKTEEFVITSKEISQIVSKFMDPENHERKEMVRRANELKDAFRKATTHGGSSASDLDAFINNILSL